MTMCCGCIGLPEDDGESTDDGETEDSEPDYLEDLKPYIDAAAEAAGEAKALAEQAAIDIEIINTSISTLSGLINPA